MYSAIQSVVLFDSLSITEQWSATIVSLQQPPHRPLSILRRQLSTNNSVSSRGSVAVFVTSEDKKSVTGFLAHYSDCWRVMKW